MAWIEITPHLVRASQPLTVSVTSNQVVFSFGAETEALLGLAAGSKVSLLLGAGPDSGKVRLKIAAAGFALWRQNKKGRMYLKVSRWIGLPPSGRPMPAAFRRIEGDCFCEIDLPSWPAAQEPARTINRFEDDPRAVRDKGSATMPLTRGDRSPTGCSLEN